MILEFQMASRQIEKAAVPVYQLYGEDQQWLTPDQVHCESIASRSRLHNWEIKPHRHHGLFQLLWLESGSALLSLDGQRGQLDAGRILLVPQHCVHGFQFSPDAQGQVITLAYPLFERLGGGLGRLLTGFAGPQSLALVDNSDQVLIASLLRAVELEYHANAPHRRLMVESLLTALLVCLLRQSIRAPTANADEPVRARRHLAQFGELIEADFGSHHPLQYYAQKIGISTAHLNAVCRQLAQRSALDLVHERIALEARRNLVYTSMTIHTISDALGFSDPAYFTRFFKRQTGLSPRAFRLRASRLGEA